MNQAIRNRFYSDFNKNHLPNQTPKTPINHYFPESPKILNLELSEPIEEFNLEEENSESIRDFMLSIPQRKGSIVSQFLNSKNVNNVNNFPNLENCNIDEIEKKQNIFDTNFPQNIEEIKCEDNVSLDSFEIEIENNKRRENSKETDSSTNNNQNKNQILNFPFGNIKKDKWNYGSEFLDEFENVSMEAVDENFNDKINQSSFFNNMQCNTAVQSKNEQTELKKRNFNLFKENNIEEERQKFYEPAKITNPFLQKKKIKPEEDFKINSSNKYIKIKDSEKEIENEVNHFKGIVKHLLDVNKGINQNIFYLQNDPRKSTISTNSNPMLLRNRSKSFNCSRMNSRPILEFMKNC